MRPPEAVDIAVIGAGPAGMAAATCAARCGARVALLDDQPTPGGQIYRAVTRARPAQHDVLGADYGAGLALTRALDAAPVTHLAGAAVWQVARERTIDYLYGGEARTLTAAAVILCTGALERPFPIPGWTLPGVMTVGAAQIALKHAGAVAATPPVLAGCGPLLYLLGSQYLRAGIRPAAVVDTTDLGAYVRAARHGLRALASHEYLRKGLASISALRDSGVPFYTGATRLGIEGERAASALSFRARARTHRIEAPLVLLHQGVVPNTQITWSLRARHRWDAAQLCFRPVTDRWGALDVEGYYVAGDNAGIVGASAAALQGQLAALAAAAATRHITRAERDARARPVQRALARDLRIRPLLEALYRPRTEHRIPADDVIVCRCEEVTAGDIRGYVRAGCVGPNQTKSFGRCGMGPCQGQQCGLTVSEIIADQRATTPATVGYFRVRPPLRAVTIGELARQAADR